MEHILKISLAATISGVVGTGFGGILALFFKDADKRFMAFILELAAGLMLSVVCFSLLPDAFAIANIYTVIGGLIIGILLAVMLQENIKYKNNNKNKTLETNTFYRTGFLMAIALGVHNLPEGLAIGTGFDVSYGLGVSLILVILVHDIPEGISVCLPLRKSGMSAFKSALITAATGLPMGIGAFIGAYFGYISEQIMALSLAIAGGTMLYIALGDIIPESKKLYGGRIAAVGNCIGFIAGIIVSILF